MRTLPPARSRWSQAMTGMSALIMAMTSLTACAAFNSLLGVPRAAVGICVAEMDVTGSVRHSGLVKLSWFLPFVRQVADGCTRRPIDAGLITRNSQAGTCQRWHLAAAKTNGNPIHDQVVESTHRDDLARGLKTLLSCGIAHLTQSHGSDLFGAFMYAGSVAGGHRGSHVYVLSDMMEDQGSWDFYHRRFDASTNRLLLAQVKRADLIPSGLTHGTVTVSGMGAGAFSNSPASLAGMQRFWQAYFAAAGATCRCGQ